MILVPSTGWKMSLKMSAVSCTSSASEKSMPPTLFIVGHIMWKASLLFSLVLLSFAGAELKRLNRAHANEILRVGFATKMNDGAMEEGERLIYELTNPWHSNYAKYLTVEEANKLFVDRHAVEKTSSFLKENGMSHVIEGNVLWVRASVKSLNGLLNTKFYHYAKGAASNIRADRYDIPHELREHVLHVFGVVHHPVSPRWIAPLNPIISAPSSGSVGPDDLQKLYGVPDKLINNSNIGTMVLGYRGGYLPEDLFNFFQHFNSSLASTGYNFPAKKMGPDYTTLCRSIDCGEPTLDMQYSMAMAPGVTTTLFNSEGDPFAEMITYLAYNDSGVQVTTVSLGFGDQGQSYYEHWCNYTLVAALRGISYFCASGDAGGVEDDCNARHNYPVECQWVIAVGGTQGPESGKKEEAWFAGGVGTSVWAPMPSWQVPWASQYFNSKSNAIVPAKANTSLAYRWYPDVAAVASSLPLYQNGTLRGGVGGTSFASPIFAGIISSINHYRDINGIPPVGYLPLVISHIINQTGVSPLYDVNSGASQSSNCVASFPAARNWDAATGFGSPNWAGLYKALVTDVIAARTSSSSSTSSTTSTTSTTDASTTDASTTDASTADTSTTDTVSSSHSSVPTIIETTGGASSMMICGGQLLLSSCLCLILFV
ncbi:tripeptidyl-peptidase 1-like [Planoprotostelium fungivorum]|uniref:Tripeptidyl-peptidase 1-like n=1 Tax=Planoprotostelium fungivorum TaxID=1890364 RepID=A0A2P6NJR4_9EUKA|nr:tripeptidyl-peptidase 1-like [Planoprotostelium fungivorum]